MSICQRLECCCNELKTSGYRLLIVVYSYNSSVPLDVWERDYSLLDSLRRWPVVGNKINLYELEKAENVRLFSTLNVNIMCVPYKLHLQIPIGNFDIPKLGTELACHPDSVNLHAAHVPSVYTTP